MIRKPWGKFDRDANARHPLVDHCLDVALVCRALLDLPRLGGLGDLQEGQKDRLALIAFLHDLGKCNRGFQAKADPSARETAGHVMEAVALFLDLKDQWPSAWTDLLTEMCGWFKGGEVSLFQMLLASISHHGRPVSEADYQNQGIERAARKWWSTADGYDPMEALALLVEAARQACPGAFASDVPPIDATASLQQRFAGLVMLADWIGSDTQFFPYRRSAHENRYAFAQAAAQRALSAIGLVTPAKRQPKPFRATFSFSPTPLQALLAETLEVCGEARLLLAESDTGSGKTEAALAWFFRLYAAGEVDGLYFALPTRVAAREIYERVYQAIEAAFEPDDRPGPVLLAAPGYVKVDGQDIGPIFPDPIRTLWDDSAQDRRRERLWSAERPKRFLAAPIAVGTIDQALLSALQVKHSLLRSVCLDRHLLVVDEVHASDPYMRELLRALLRGHLSRGGWALLLSATLGETAVASFFDREVTPLAEAIARPYPLLSTPRRMWPLPRGRARRIEVKLVPDLTNDDPLVPMLVEALQRGARILVVCNTVARANALFRRVETTLQRSHPELLSALFNLDGVRCPHHGRFAREDREQLDAAVTAQLGKNSPGGARLLIGTQTLEQSLDIDADWLVTDLAPMDVLIQRFGRLHRHARAGRPPGFEAPRALVRVPPRNLATYLSKNGELRAPAGLGSVYPDGRVLVRTWESLQEDPVLVLPEQARERIEGTTHEEAFANLPEAWVAHGHALYGKVLMQVHQAQRSVLDDRPFGELHYVDKSEDVLTRLGDPTFELPLAAATRSPFGVVVRRVAIPARWLAREKDVPEVVSADLMPDGFRLAIGKTAMQYTRLGLERKDDA